MRGGRWGGNRRVSFLEDTNQVKALRCGGPAVFLGLVVSGGVEAHEDRGPPRLLGAGGAPPASSLTLVPPTLVA